MRKLTLLSIFLFSIVGHAEYSTASGIKKEGFVEIQENTVESHNYNAARDLAIQLIHQAQGAMTEAGQSLSVKIIEHLKNTKFLVSSNERSEAKCLASKFALFVSNKFPNTIFVCGITREHAMEAASERTLNMLAQGFVHEGVHLANIHDECVATLYERSVMHNTIGIQTDINYERYYDGCKKDW